MFTGIINHCGEVLLVNTHDKGRCITLKSQFTDLALGESIAVDGICLTLMAINQNSFDCEISPETLAVTTAADFTNKQQVNLERAMRANDRFGGHMVSGHVDTTAQLAGINPQGDYFEYTFTGIHSKHQGLLIPKGSVCVNGVSLTLNRVSADGFSVMLIPHTLEITNLKTLQTNAIVNIEFDMIAKIVTHNMSQQELNHA